MIRREVMALPDPHRQVIIMYHFENAEIDQIAREMNVSESDICRFLDEGLRLLQRRLIESVHKRWPKRFRQKCPICNHPRRKEIDQLLTSRKPTNSWGKTNRAIKRRFGCTFNPPFVMINHLKYHI